MQIPFVDLKAQHAALRGEIRAALDDALDSMNLLLGPNVRAFESELAAYCGVRHAIGVGSGTDALYLALRGCGIGQGDEVITVANSFIATAAAIALTGATPVFVDVDPHTKLIDPERIRAAITPKTRAIVPVHLFGQVADMSAILDLAREHDLRVVEDACQAHGATHEGRRAGSLGDAAAFSFYMSKNLGAYGEGGAVTTSSDQIAERVRRLRDHGSVRKYEHVELGLNSRLDELQAAVLRVKLRHLDAWNALRRRHVERYGAALDGVDVALPATRNGDDSVFHLYVIQAPPGLRDTLQRTLAARGVATGIHYPIPIHQQPAMRRTTYCCAALPVTEALAPRILSLPMFPELQPDQIEYVGACLREVVPVSRQSIAVGGAPLAADALRSSV
jgi:dTDP-4-amino-4,6-dideoxygalactose transaminase